LEAIDQVPFNFDPRIGLIVGIMVGFLVFAVALDLTWEQLRRVVRSPKAPGIGLFAQFGILPAVAFGAGMYLTDVPSVALGLLLVTCCPGGALSNYLTGVARGDVATSISMTTVSTLFSLVLTPFLFALWASMNPSTRAALADIQMNPQQVVMTLLIMLIVPVTAGMLLRAKRPDIADRIRLWTRRIVGLVFAVVVMIIGGNIKSLALVAEVAVLPVLLTFALAIAFGWGLARLSDSWPRTAAPWPSRWHSKTWRSRSAWGSRSSLRSPVSRPYRSCGVLSTWCLDLVSRSRGIASHFGDGSQLYSSKAAPSSPWSTWRAVR
jgi:BASS family bile acid:Na+ symporter